MMQVFTLHDLLVSAKEEADGTLVEPDADKATALAVAMCAPGESVTIHEQDCRAEFGDCTCTSPMPMTYGPKLVDAWDDEQTEPER